MPFAQTENVRSDAEGMSFTPHLWSCPLFFNVVAWAVWDLEKVDPEMSQFEMTEQVI